MKVAVVGCGAMGSIYAGLFAAARFDVLAVGRNRAHMAAIDSDGLRITGASGDRQVRLRAFTRPPEEVVDLLILAVKAGQVAQAADESAVMVGPDTGILTIQNGLGSAELVAERLGADRLMVGVAQGFGASLEAPGHVHHNNMKAIRMGGYAGIDAAEVERTAALWREAGFDAEAVADILTMQWDKLICNAAFSALCALTGLSVGEVMADELAAGISRAAATEAWRVAQALDIPLPFDDPVAHVQAFAAGMPRARPSVLQDLEAKRITEVDVINGSIVREAGRIGLEAPVNGTLTALVRLQEKRNQEALTE
jgi:2-dehydropantoate 2-reductase